MAGTLLKPFQGKKVLGVLWEYPGEGSNRYTHMWTVLLSSITYFPPGGGQKTEEEQGGRAIGNSFGTHQGVAGGGTERREGDRERERKDGGGGGGGGNVGQSRRADTDGVQ